MGIFKRYLAEAFDIPLNSDSDIESFETNIDKKVLKDLLSIIKKSDYKDIAFAGDEKGNIKVRGGISISDLDKFRKKHRISKAKLRDGKGSLGSAGKKSNISGSDWEQIIAAAYNMKSKNVDLDTAIKLGGMQKSWLKKFDAYIDIGTKIVENSFTQTPDKMNHFGDKYADLNSKWDNYFIQMTGKSATSPTRTPKTDMYISSQHISLKKEGGSQFMSGGKPETLATLNFAYQSLPMKIKTEKLDSAFNGLINDITNGFDSVKLEPGQNITKIKQDLKSGKKSVFLDQVSKVISSNQNLTKSIKSLLETSELSEAVVRESMTGKNKFADNLAAATHMMVFNESGNSSYKPIDDSLVKKYAKAVDFSISFKTGSTGGSAQSVLRGRLNENLLIESFNETETEFLTEGLFDKLRDFGRGAVSSFKQFVLKWITKFVEKVKKLIYKGLFYLKDILGIEIRVSNPKIRYSI